MNTPNHTVPDVPAENFTVIRDVLKAHGVSLLDVTYEVQCTCDACGAEWSEEASLENPLSEAWYECFLCHPKTGEGDDAHT